MFSYTTTSIDLSDPWYISYSITFAVADLPRLTETYRSCLNHCFHRAWLVFLKHHLHLLKHAYIKFATSQTYLILIIASEQLTMSSYQAPLPRSYRYSTLKLLTFVYIPVMVVLLFALSIGVFFSYNLEERRLVPRIFIIGFGSAWG